MNYWKKPLARELKVKNRDSYVNYHHTFSEISRTPWFFHNLGFPHKSMSSIHVIFNILAQFYYK